MRKEHFDVVFILFVLATTGAQSKNVGGNKKNTSQKTNPLTSSYTIKELKADSLKLHNEYRLKHNSMPLKLNQTLCNNAQNWAEKLINRKDNKLVHQTVSDYGENLYAMWSSKPIVVRAKDAFLSWYNEKDHYDYAKGPTKGRVTGHFTQIVWKNTQDLGVGMAKNPRKTVIVATYYPRGNYVDMYKENVSKPKK